MSFFNMLGATISNVFSILASVPSSPTGSKPASSGEIFPVPFGKYKFLEPLVNFLNEAIVPFTVTLGVLAGLFGIVICFMIMKAESAEAANIMKKRLWQLMLTVVSVIALVWLLGFATYWLPVLINRIRGK